MAAVFTKIAISEPEYPEKINKFIVLDKCQGIYHSLEE
jgi:hypothetical protein